MLERSELLLQTPDGEPLDRVAGFETEYGLSVSVDDNEDTLFRLLRIDKQYHPQEFQDDGSRIYLDVGTHPEYATAEDTDYMTVAHRALVGHAIMTRRYQRNMAIFTETYPGEAISGAVALYANTTSPNGASWASHGNLLARRALSPDQYINALAAQHVSRIVWSGSGHVDQDKSGRFKYSLSEKAGFIMTVASDITVMNRPLVNLRDEPLADSERYRRIHDVSGETNFSPLAGALRLAADSIVLRAVEAGTDFDDLMPVDPMAAIRTISEDPSLQAKIRLQNGHAVTGLQHQKSMHERAFEAADKAENLTKQEYCFAERWLGLLERLEAGAMACGNAVDWVTKLRLIDKELARPRRTPATDYDIALAKSLEYHRLLPMRGNHGDAKPGFGMQLLQKGYFLDSPCPELLGSSVPLPETRAKIRASLVAATANQGTFRIDWNSIMNKGTGRRVVLQDPYSTEPTHPAKLAALLQPGW